MHSISQFSATIYTLINIDTSFSPMFAVQLAAFLIMTSSGSLS